MREWMLVASSKVRMRKIRLTVNPVVYVLAEELTVRRRR